MSTALLTAVIVASVAAGMVCAPRLPGHGVPMAKTLARVLLWALFPIIYFFVMARLQLSAGVGVGLLFAYAELGVVGMLAWLAATRWLHLTRPATGALVVSVVLANTGYLGLPLVTSLLGNGALGPAIAYDAAVSAPMFFVVAMAIGAVFGAAEDEPATAGATALAIVRNPSLVAVVAGLVAGRVAPSVAPDALLHLSHDLVYVSVPIAFFMVGISVRDEGSLLRFPPPLTPAVGVVVGLRLVLAPLLMLALSLLVVPVPHAYLLQAAMPCGANGLIAAHVHDLDVRLPASAIAWTTSLVLIAGVLGSVLT